MAEYCGQGSEAAPVSLKDIKYQYDTEDTRKSLELFN